jgi:hypothetical protein
MGIVLLSLCYKVNKLNSKNLKNEVLLDWLKEYYLLTQAGVATMGILTNGPCPRTGLGTSGPTATLI